jgi:MFS family permease
MFVLFSCLGLGQFSLGMLLPSMGISLNLNYSQMGHIGTGNFVGYMISVVLAGMIARRIGARWTISIGIFGLAVWSIPTIMSAAVGDYTGPVRAVKAFGFITLFLGVGQITGPPVAGFTADFTGTFSMAFWLCSLLPGFCTSRRLS